MKRALSHSTVNFHPFGCVPKHEHLARDKTLYFVR
ncbi:hypothetical protein EDE11_10367 [Methylomonas methanica]|uniref:Uncharacterized protein n=1 Tax=Methylomonas methanica TaxID=421 RepID=A0ABY2CQF2_METMH|nr:hypothetical protein EDE11_10367 [Methylomonas methanica]